MPPTSATRRWVAAVVLTAATIGLLLAAFASAPLSARDPALAVPLAFAVGFVPVGLFLLRQRPASRLAWLTWTIGLLATFSTASLLGPPWPPSHWLAQWAWWPPLALLPLVLVYFPDPPPPRSRRALGARILAINAVVSTLLLAGVSLSDGAVDLTDPTTHATGSLRVAYLVVVAGVALAVAGFAVRAVGLVRAVRRTPPPQRNQYACLVPCAGLAAVGVPLAAAGVDYALVPAILALPVGSAIAVVQYNYDDLGRRVARESIRVLLVGIVIATIATIAFWLCAVAVGDVVPYWLCVALTAGVAALDVPRLAVTAAVDRWLFGHRSDPYRVLSTLATQRQESPNPGAMLAKTTATIVGDLAIPYARITLVADAGDDLLAESGQPTGDLVTFELRMPEGTLGHLDVAPRRVGERFTHREGHLFEQIAHQTSFVVYAHQLTADLRAAREVLVFSREEERLRLRRDLHDGLGPVLTGARMQLSVAAGLVESGPAVDLVRTVLGQLGEAGTTVRELIEGLRPASLDLGLLVALRQTAAGVLAEIDHDVVAPNGLPPLLPAVEVAAYRIASEAMHNIVRHAGAARSRLTLTTDDTCLTLTVADDGRGIASNHHRGVGLGSMADRADELGGSLTVTNTEPGTTIRAVLPLRPPPVPALVPESP